ncbi:MAG: glutaredoxin [Bacteriovoracaceae bacterium]|jgi:monothiol glutaredoxin
MKRLILAETSIHPDALTFITCHHQETVQEVIEAIKMNKVVVVGMKQNPVVKKARKALDEKKISYEYLEYGSYLSQWKKRLAIKLWSGWPTYPQIFINGQLIGGCEDLVKYLATNKI